MDFKFLNFKKLIGIRYYNNYIFSVVNSWWDNIIFVVCCFQINLVGKFCGLGL